MLSCFGGCGGNCGCGNGCGRDNNCCGSDNCGCDRDRQRNGCRRAVERAVNECGSERAVMKKLKERERDCDRRPDCDCAGEREERSERRGERMADNNSCDAPNMNPPHWQDFPEVSRSSSRDDCGCDS